MFRSHVAQKTGAALPNGHVAIDRRVRLQMFGERGVHLIRAQGSKFRRFVKFSPLVVFGGRDRLRHSHERPTVKNGDLSGLRRKDVHPRRPAAAGFGTVQEMRASNHDADATPAV